MMKKLLLATMPILFFACCETALGCECSQPGPDGCSVQSGSASGCFAACGERLCISDRRAVGQLLSPSEVEGWPEAFGDRSRAAQLGSLFSRIPSRSATPSIRSLVSVSTTSAKSGLFLSPGALEGIQPLVSAIRGKSPAK